VGVQLVAVTDPAQGADQFTTPDPGKRFVGVTLQVTNRSGTTLTSDGDNNTTIVGSNRQDYTSDVNSLAGCTDFASHSSAATRRIARCLRS